MSKKTRNWTRKQRKAIQRRTDPSSPEMKRAAWLAMSKRAHAALVSLIGQTQADLLIYRQAYIDGITGKPIPAAAFIGMFD